MLHDPKLLQSHAEIVLRDCACLKPGELALLLFDATTRDIEPYLTAAAKGLTASVEVAYVDVAMHGVEPTAAVAEAMARADVIVAATQYSLAHTQARFAATNRGARYLSLPQYGAAQLARHSLEVDFRAQAAMGKELKRILDGAKTVHITSKAGTDLRLSVAARSANWAPGYCDEAGMLGSPPDIETNIAPVETESSGVLVVDGSIPCEALGLLKEPLRVELRGGSIVTIDESTGGTILQSLFGEVEKRKVLAEFGIGLNPKAELCGLMLEDEGALGTVHFGFGSNATIGGQNSTDFHLDMVIKNPTVEVDGRRIMEQGRLML